MISLLTVMSVKATLVMVMKKSADWNEKPVWCTNHWARSQAQKCLQLNSM